MEKWQFNVLFFVGVLGAVVLFLGPEVGLNAAKNPGAFTGVGAILTYVLTKKDDWTKPDNTKQKKKEVDDDVG